VVEEAIFLNNGKVNQMDEERLKKIRKDLNDCLIEQVQSGRSVNFKPYSILRDLISPEVGIFERLEERDSKIKELEKQVEFYKNKRLDLSDWNEARRMNKTLLAENQSLKAEVKRLREALLPLADMFLEEKNFSYLNSVKVTGIMPTYADSKRAKAALSKDSEGGKV